jgi:hypothetical protein
VPGATAKPAADRAQTSGVPGEAGAAADEDTEAGRDQTLAGVEPVNTLLGTVCDEQGLASTTSITQGTHGPVITRTAWSTPADEVAACRPRGSSSTWRASAAWSFITDNWVIAKFAFGPIQTAVQGVAGAFKSVGGGSAAHGAVKELEAGDAASFAPPAGAGRPV